MEQAMATDSRSRRRLARRRSLGHQASREALRVSPTQPLAAALPRRFRQVACDAALGLHAPARMHVHTAVTHGVSVSSCPLRTMAACLDHPVLRLARLHGVKVEGAGSHVAVAARHAVGKLLDATATGAVVGHGGGALQHMGNGSVRVSAKAYQ